MNFKLKTIVAASVLAVSATSANAAIDLGSVSPGNSELVFSAWDSVAGVGYTYDLLSSLTLQSFIGADVSTSANATMLANAVVDNSLITGPNGQILDVALTGIPFSSNFANVEWNLAGVDLFGRGRALTTKDLTDATPFAISNNNVRSAMTAMNSYFSQANALAVAQGNTGDDAFNTSIPANDAGYPGNYGNNWSGFFGDTTNALGGTSFVYFTAQTTQASSAAPALFKQMATATGENLVVSTYQQAGQWRLNLSVAQTAPIPEPETYAMFLAGLGMMGAVARRRKGQVK
jgi:hypothetical protein